MRNLLIEQRESKYDQFDWSKEGFYFYTTNIHYNVVQLDCFLQYMTIGMMSKKSYTSTLYLSLYNPSMYRVYNVNILRRRLS